MMAPYQRYSLRRRIFFSFLAALLPVVIFCVAAIEIYLVPAISANARQELHNATLMLKSSVQTAADVAVRNHLKAIAEKNAEIVSHLLNRVAAGELDLEETKKRAREILLAQRIGNSGYIYCLDSHGMAVVHPNPVVENTDNTRFAFVREQMARKQGYIEYEWQNPGEEGVRAKALYMVYVPGLDWIISVSSYRAEFTELIDIGDFKNLVLSPRFGASGYAYVVNQQGDALIHPVLYDYNVFLQSDLSVTFLRTMIDNGSGTIEYRWRNPGESAIRDKIAVYESIDEYGWLIVSSSYKSEIFGPAATARKVAYGATVFLCLAAAFITYLLSGRLTRPVTAMIAQLDRNTRQLSHEQLPVYGDDELGRLAGEFNTFLATIEASNEELQRQKDRYLSLFDTSPDAVILLRGQVLIDCNPAALQIFAGAKEAIIGKTVVCLSPPEQHNGRSSADLAVQLIAEAKPGCLQTFEWQHQALDGRRFDAEVQLKRFGEDGGEVLLVAFIRDITQRKRAEEHLRKSEERFLLAMKASHDGLFDWNLETNEIYYSPAWKKMLGYEDHELPNDFSVWEKNIDPEDARKAWQLHQKLVSRQIDRFIIEFKMLHKDGHWVDILSRAEALFNDSGKAVRMVGTHVDITARKRAEMEKERLEVQLNQAHKMESVGRLAGGVAHDFNNMLGVILGYTELAMGRVEPDDPLHANLEKIQEAAQRSADLTQQLLAFARKQTVSPRVIDLNDTIESILKLLLRLIGEDINLVWQPGKEIWPVKIDPTQIDQIMTNLCVNARDAIIDLGKVTIETGNAFFEEDYCRDHAGFMPGEYAMLAVSDNGCGMDEETQSHLFEPFFTTKEMGKGTGLGLATVYGVVKQNNGFIHVYSEPGQGTTFKIYLPRHLAKIVPLPEKKPEKPGDQGHETVLLVEDELGILEMTTTMLEKLGYTVLAAGTPGEAIRLAQEHSGRIDLLLTDVIMPEMNGRDLTHKLLPICPGIRRLFMSGYTASVIAHHGVLDEGVHFIQKPFSIKDLGRKLREALES
jgi:PAS domain S-box-containing protein